MCHLFAALDITACPEEQVISCNQIDTEDVENENQDESVVAMIEEPHSGILTKSSPTFLFCLLLFFDKQWGFLNFHVFCRNTCYLNATLLN